jgi:16S rRNA processing protein RimM
MTHLEGNAPKRTLRIGVVVRAHGLRGEVRVRPDTDFPERFRTLKRVLVMRGGELVAHEVQHVRAAGDAFLVKLAGVDAAHQAQQLAGAPLHVSSEEASPLPEGQFYIDDVIGLEVLTTDGQRLGHVAEVLRTGANDVYVVRGGKSEILVPAIRDVVAELAPHRGRMVVRMMSGLMDE